MKPNEQNLERLLKKLIKQQPVSSADLLFHWQGLGDRGDRVVISTLNKQNGWEYFVLWGESEPEIKRKLKQISDHAGISEGAVLALKSSGLISADTESPRSQALWILQTVRKGLSEDWDRAISLLFQSQGFFEGTLSLLDLEESPQTALFLTKLLDARPSREQDQAIRKALYRFRQKGIEAPVREKMVVRAEMSQRAEIFLFAENRLPLWQPFFYYRSTGARGDWFFAEINEGKGFEIIQQQRDIRMNQKAMHRIADNYAGEFQKSTGVPMTFTSMPPSHARYFLEKSFQRLRGSEDFRKYMGEARKEDPSSGLNARTNLVSTDAVLLLNHNYFQLWLVEDDFLDGVFKRLEQIEEGPIILPEQQRRHQRSEALDQALHEYFSDDKRSCWALALEKASYFLKNSDPETASIAYGFSKQLSDLDSNIQSGAFANVLLERSLEIRKEQMARQKKEEKRSSLIVTPQEFERNLNAKTPRRKE